MPIFLYLSYAALAVRIAFILMVLSGPDGFNKLGMGAAPEFLQKAFDNKILAILMVSLIGGQLESWLVSTGAFEVYFNEQLVWSKLEVGRPPSPDELMAIVSPNTMSTQ